MLVVNVITFILTLANTFGSNNFGLSELIEKIHRESDSENVCFIGTNNEFLTEFIRKNVNIQVLIITSLSEAYREMPYTSILVLQVSHQEQITTASLLKQFILTLRVRKFVIVSSDNFEKLHDYFLFFEENKFVRIFGIWNDTGYAYLPYAANQIQHVRFDSHALLPDPLKDLNGLIFRTTVERNIPRTFWYTTKEGQRKIGGCFGQIFLGFLRRHNATYKEIIINDSSDMYMPGILNATIHNQIDISMNAYGSSKGLDSSYPVKLGRFLVMVPLKGYVDPNEYFKRPFSTTLWILIGLTLFYIVLMDVLLKLSTKEAVDVWQSFSQMFLAMIGVPRERPVTTNYRLHVQVFVLSFILVNFYVISFTSYLTVYIKVKQFNTLQDLIDNNFKVMMGNFIWGSIAQSQLYPPGFDKIVTTVDYKTYLREMYSMKNTSFAYGLGADTSEFLIRLQACFEKPLFHMTRDSLLEYNIGFILQRHSPFKDALSLYIFHVMETGLINKWDLDVVSQARHSGLEELNIHRGNTRISQSMHVALTVRHLIFCWNLLAIGWTVATFVFVGEKFGSVVRTRNCL